MERSVLWEESLATGNLAFLDLLLGSCHSQSGWLVLTWTLWLVLAWNVWLVPPWSGWVVGSLLSWASRWVFATVNQVRWFLHGGVGSSQGPRPTESELGEPIPLEQVIGLQWSSLQHSYETSAVYILSAQALPFCHPQNLI